MPGMAPREINYHTHFTAREIGLGRLNHLPHILWSGLEPLCVLHECPAQEGPITQGIYIHGASPGLAESQTLDIRDAPCTSGPLALAKGEKH